MFEKKIVVLEFTINLNKKLFLYNYFYLHLSGGCIFLLYKGSMIFNNFPYSARI